jgi:hypothetical protein
MSADDKVDVRTCPMMGAMSRLSTYALIVMNIGAGSRGLVPPLLRDQVFRRYWGASVIGAGAVGGMLGSVLCKRLTARLGAGLVYVAGCLVFTGPLALVPLAAGAHGGTVLVMLFAAEFLSGFGVMVLDISIAAIFAVVIPDTMRSRGVRGVPGDQLRNPAGRRAAGGLLGGAVGLQVALWIAVAGGVVGALLLLPSPLPRFRLPR